MWSHLLFLWNLSHHIRQILSLCIFNSVIIMMVIIAECVKISLVSPTFCNPFALIFFKKNYVLFVSVHVCTFWRVRSLSYKFPRWNQLSSLVVSALTCWAILLTLKIFLPSINIINVGFSRWGWEKILICVSFILHYREQMWMSLLNCKCVKDGFPGNDFLVYDDFSFFPSVGFFFLLKMYF